MVPRVCNYFIFTGKCPQKVAQKNAQSNPKTNIKLTIKAPVMTFFQHIKHMIQSNTTREKNRSWTSPNFESEEGPVLESLKHFHLATINTILQIS